MTSRSLRGATIAIIYLVAHLGLSGQTIRYYSDLDRVLKDLDSIDSPGLFRSSFGGYEHSSSTEEKAPRLQIMPAQTFVSYNSAFPFGNNDGALWQGVGLNMIAQAGAELSWGWGQLTLQPEWWFSQNSSYPMAPSSGETQFADYGADLDRLQAYGRGAFSQFNFGESELRLEYAGFTLGFGTKNHKFGPAESQNLLLSDNASGFPMLDIGLDGPYRTRYGSFDARFFWGQTSSSEFFYADGNTQKRLFTGGLLSYSAPFLPGMSFGFQRVFHSPWSTINGWKVFEFFDDTVWKSYRIAAFGIAGGDDDIDQILSFTWEWRVPLTGSRAYIEWGRNDHASDLQDFMMQPDHSMGYVGGVQQKIELGPASRILISYEMADVGNTIGSIVRPTGSWYRHGLTEGGYTNDGQILGAYMGPGSNTQELNIYYQASGFFVRIGLQRWLFDADYYYSLNPASYANYNLLFSYMIGSGIKLGTVEIGASIFYTYNYNRNFIPGDPIENLHLDFSVKASF